MQQPNFRDAYLFGIISHAKSVFVGSKHVSFFVDCTKACLVEVGHWVPFCDLRVVEKQRNWALVRRSLRNQCPGKKGGTGPSDEHANLRL